MNVDVTVTLPHGHDQQRCLTPIQPRLIPFIAFTGARQTKMDVLKAVQTYVTKMITEVSGMKVLLLDSHTVRFVSALVTGRPLAPR